MKPVEFHPDALKEFDDAATYYDIRSKEVALSLIDQTSRAITRIADMPEAYPVHGKKTRRCVLRGFPYNIFYAIDPDFIRVVAFAHQKRRPFYWRTRLREV